MITMGLKADFETIAKAYRETAFQRRAVLQEIWGVLNNATSPDEKLDTIKSMVKASGVYIREDDQG